MTPEDYQKIGASSLVPFIEKQFPGHIRGQTSSVGDKALAVYFMEAYYEWLEQQGNAKARIDEFKNIINVNYSVGEFFEHLRKTYLAPIPANVRSDRALLIKHVKEIYASKGTVKSIKFLFRLLFDEAVDVSFDPSRRLPGDDIPFDDEVWRLGQNFTLGFSTLGFGGNLNSENILFLDYNSLHKSIGYGLLGEDFVLGSSELVPQPYIDAAIAQGIDINTFRGTVLIHVPENYTYYIETYLTAEQFHIPLVELVHPAGTQYFVKEPDNTGACQGWDSTIASFDEVNNTFDNDCRGGSTTDCVDASSTIVSSDDYVFSADNFCADSNDCITLDTVTTTLDSVEFTMDNNCNNSEFVYCITVDQTSYTVDSENVTVDFLCSNSGVNDENQTTPLCVTMDIDTVDVSRTTPTVDNDCDYLCFTADNYILDGSQELPSGDSACT